MVSQLPAGSSIRFILFQLCESSVCVIFECDALQTPSGGIKKHLLSTASLWCGAITFPMGPARLLVWLRLGFGVRRPQGQNRGVAAAPNPANSAFRQKRNQSRLNNRCWHTKHLPRFSENSAPVGSTMLKKTTEKRKIATTRNFADVHQERLHGAEELILLLFYPVPCVGPAKFGGNAL